jgi:hypothetical protein
MLRRLSLAIQIVIVVVCIVIVGITWLVFRAVAAGSHLASVRDDIANVRADLINGRDPTADLRQAQADARAADRETHDPVWFAASWIPPVHTVRGLASAADELAAHALPSVVDVGTTLEPSRLRVAHNKIALAPLRHAVPALTTANRALHRARDEVAGLSAGWGLLGDIRGKVLDELSSLTGSVDDATRFARVGPAMLGGNGPRRYLVGVENNAEARATGGLLAAYAVVTARNGVLHVAEHGSDSRLQSFITPRRSPVVSLPSEYADVYGNFRPAQSWIASNLSPNFPDAARIWAHLWQIQSGKHIDGAFGVDPFALQALLAATGPVSVRGYPGVYSGTNLAQYVEQQEYVDFPGLDSELRKQFTSKVATAVIHKTLSGIGDPQAITTALGRSAGTGHLALWSARPNEQAQISGTPLAGELSRSPGPFASVSVDSAIGSKLDYYLDRALTYTAASCSGDVRNSVITVRLTNNAPLRGLPPYVRLRGDHAVVGPEVVEKTPQNRLFVYIHTTAGASLRAPATLDGRPILMSQGIERGHAVYGAEVTLDPGVSTTLQLRLAEPSVPGAPLTKVQPMARPQQTRLRAPVCG